MLKFFRGVHFFFTGFRFLLNNKIRQFIFIPLLINFLIFSVLGYVVFTQLSQWINNIMSYFPAWLFFFKYLFWITVFSLFSSLTFIFFSMVSNFLAAPFNSLLAEQIQKHYGNCISESINENLSVEILLSFAREFKKIRYNLFKIIVLLVMSFIPIVNSISPLLWFIYSSWYIALQYCDLAADNRKYTFESTLDNLKKHRMCVMGFGVTAFVFTLFPFVNFLVMPASVIGSTFLWEKEIELNK